ncbi:unnamed protein product [Lampetra fluviatilis]
MRARGFSNGPLRPTGGSSVVSEVGQIAETRGRGFLYQYMSNLLALTLLVSLVLGALCQERASPWEEALSEQLARSLLAEPSSLSVERSLHESLARLAKRSWRRKPHPKEFVALMGRRAVGT